jgi:hypothetical protein
MQSSNHDFFSVLVLCTQINMMLVLLLVARHIFQACPVWIYTLRVTPQASYSPEYITPTQIIKSCCLSFNTRSEFIELLDYI